MLTDYVSSPLPFLRLRGHHAQVLVRVSTADRPTYFLVCFPLFSLTISRFPFSFLATASHVFKHYHFVESKASQQRFVLLSAQFSSSSPCVPLSSTPLSSEVIAFTTGTISALF